MNIFKQPPHGTVLDLIMDAGRYPDLKRESIEVVYNIHPLDSEMYNSTATIKIEGREKDIVYNRVDLGKLFSMIELKVKGDVKRLAPAIVRYINSHYNVNLGDDTYLITEDGDLYLCVGSNNPAYKGKVKVSFFADNLNGVDLPNMYEFDYGKIFGEWIIAPKATNPVGSIITVKEEDYDPNEELIGKWELLTPLAMEAEEYDLFRSPRGMFFDHFKFEKKFENVTLICLDDCEHAIEFNKGVAERVVEEYDGKSHVGWKITHLDGDYTLPISTRVKMEGVYSYYIFDKKKGYPYEVGSPELNWERIE